MENHTTDTTQDLAQLQFDLLKKRKSPVAFADKEISKEKLEQLFEAARWAASSFNEQPWRFIVARKEQTELFSKVLKGINEHNQKWAKNAAVLILTFAKSEFSNGKPNQHSWHDVGLAVGNLSAQATAMNIYLHQMAGIERHIIMQQFDIPAGFEAVSAIGLGYKGDPEQLEDDSLKAREKKERVRKSLNEIVFDQEWGESSF